ncbi:hypothetical protein [Bradyrhizobium sp. I1.7.5]
MIEPKSFGTGFFFSFPVEQQQSVSVLITNNHVVAAADRLKF